ncbi:hypothetical protein BY996DRAFT_6503605 [Phakopsora pachyrhizi]|nr:hypothetical protein BY996DRAFT_6503605 [Phakopsora pachyrhizi]
MSSTGSIFKKQRNQLTDVYALATDFNSDIIAIFKEVPNLSRLEWEDLFSTGSEHSSALSQMKLSPYYKSFEKDAMIWTDRLNRMSEIFGKWINTLDRLVESLSQLQKALGDYLECERKDILRYLKHLKKMFAGLLALIIDQDLTRKENMCSREGREIPFPTPIILKNSQKINNRLSKLKRTFADSFEDFGRSCPCCSWRIITFSVANPIESLSIHMANAVFPYGFKYLGVPDRLEYGHDSPALKAVLISAGNIKKARSSSWGDRGSNYCLC